MEQKAPFFHTYNDYTVYALNKAYFLKKCKEGTFEAVKLYKQKPNESRQEETETDEYLERDTLVTAYQQSKDNGQKFFLFNPISLESGDRNDSVVTRNYEQALKFMILHKESRPEPKGNEFFLLPICDQQSKHWTVLKVNLSADDVFSAEHYDPSPTKKSETKRWIMTGLQNLNKDIKMATPFLMQQIDTWNCGPYSLRLIRLLAHGKKPTVYPQTAFNYRVRDLKVIKALKKTDPEKESDKNNELKWTRQINQGLFVSEIPRAVKYKDALLISGLLIGGIAILCLSVLLPPVGILLLAGALVALAAEATSVVLNANSSSLKKKTSLFSYISKNFMGLFKEDKQEKPILNYDTDPEQEVVDLEELVLPDFKLPERKDLDRGSNPSQHVPQRSDKDPSNNNGLEDKGKDKNEGDDEWLYVEDDKKQGSSHFHK